MDVLLGLQWGDEGKGKIVDVLTPNYNVIARFQGGPNAGHTLEFEGIKHVLHTIPSGIFRKNAINVVGNGVVIDPIIFKREIDALDGLNVDVSKTLKISKKAHLILPTHRLLDAASEKAKGKGKIGSTLKGIGPTYMDKTGRNGLRVGDIVGGKFKEKYNFLKQKHEQMLGFYSAEGVAEEMEAEWFASLETLQRFEFIDSEQYLNDHLQADNGILAEGGSRLTSRYRFWFLPICYFIQYGMCRCLHWIGRSSKSYWQRNWHFQGLLYTCWVRALPHRVV